jgi:hypothetical protein
MTPDQQAKRLILEFKNKLPAMQYYILDQACKDCALICAEQCRLEAYKQGNEMAGIREKFWYDVIQELNQI